MESTLNTFFSKSTSIYKSLMEENSDKSASDNLGFEGHKEKDELRFKLLNETIFVHERHKNMRSGWIEEKIL